MQNRGLSVDVIDRRIHEFKQKTLPSAKYFDDQRLLHLVSLKGGIVVPANLAQKKISRPAKNVHNIKTNVFS